MSIILWPDAQYGPKRVIRDMLGLAKRSGFNASKDSDATRAVRSELPRRIVLWAERNHVRFDYEAQRTWLYLQAELWGFRREPPVLRGKVSVELLYKVPLLWACRLLFVPMREVSRPNALHELQYEFCRLLDGYGYEIPEQRSKDKPFGRPWNSFPLYQIVCDNDWKEGIAAKYVPQEPKALAAEVQTPSTILVQSSVEAVSL